MLRAPVTASLPPSSDRRDDPRLPRRAIGVGVVALVVLLQLATQVASGHDRGRLLSSVLFLAVELPLLMGGLSALYAAAARRSLGSLRTLAVGLVLAFVLGGGTGALFWELAQHYPWIRLHSGAAPATLLRGVLWGLFHALLHLGLWTLAFVFPFAVEDARVRALEAETLRLEAEKLKSAAELARLRAHLEPHFLLNTLNAIAGLVTDDPREARRLLVCLGDLLRDSLHEEDEVQPLDEQMSWLRRYAEILEARHAGNLVFRWEIAGEARDVPLPRLLLQPLVENAVKHGALRRPGGGEVVVKAKVVDEGGTSRVVCTVEDNGPGMPSKPTRSGAFGLHAVRRRLELRYAGAAALRLESTGEGTRSIVELPVARGEALGAA
jgi:signal transduction histidine kinase